MKKEIKILLIEDNAGDTELIRETLKDNTSKSKMIVIDNGEDAINYLSNQQKVNISQLPNLILLDINLPRVDGKEVLHFIKNHDVLKMIPVVILTTSSLKADVDYAYRNYASCYIVKSGNLSEFQLAIHSLENFWMNCISYFNKI